MPAIINLRPTQDAYVTIRACRPACDARCGDCALCDRACPENCRQGVKDGTGHVWLLLDRIPVHEMQRLIDARQQVLALAEIERTLRAGEAVSEEQAEAATAALAVLQSAVVAIFRRDYPEIDEAHLVATLELPGLLQVATAFLSRLAANFGPPQTATPVPATTSATPKRLRSSAK